MAEHHPDGSVPAHVALSIQPQPLDQSNWLGAGDYYVYVALSARDTEACYYVADIHFEGHWWDAPDIKRHLQIVRPPRPIDADVIGKFS